MLSRGNSSAGARLRRAKSASSVQTYRAAGNNSTPIDPEIAHQDALTAASVAFDQAHGRKLQAKRSGDISANSSPERRLNHRQSIRFTGPSAVPTNQRSITRRESSKQKITAERSKTLPNNPRSRHGSSVRTSDSFVTALPDQNEEYVERMVSSEPSSYRKLRKTKSMVNPSKASGLSIVSGFSRSRVYSRSHSLRPHNDNTHKGAHQDSRLRKSISFLRQSTASSQSPRNSIETDQAVQLARDQFVRQLEEQREKEKTSTVDIDQQRKSAKPFRRTVRTSSTNSYGSSIASPAAEALVIPKKNGLGHKARNMSVSLKDRLKKVFRKPSDPEAGLPTQQLNASRAHFGDFESTFNGIQQHYDHPIPEPDKSTVRRIDSRGNTFRDKSAFVEKPTYPGSIRSLESTEDTEKDNSRVSSWGTSTLATSLASLPSRENKRLSTINEGAPYQPSSVRSQGNLAHNFGASTDPSRDFSAGSLYVRLRREIENNQCMAREQEDAMDPEERAARGPNYIANLTPRGSSLSTPQHHGIRTSKSLAFNPQQGLGEQGIHSQSRRVKIEEVPTMDPSESDKGLGGYRDHGDWTPKRPLREVRSAFFPPSVHVERSSPSPYRQVMRGSSEDDATPRRRVSTSDDAEQSPFLRVRNFTDSDSIYSRTTSGHTPRASNSPSTSSEEDLRSGTAFVARNSTKYDHLSSPSHRRKTSSVQSSGDWKRWLSTEVAQLERRVKMPNQAHNLSSTVTYGHKRENAQLNEDDVEIGSMRTVRHGSMVPVAYQQTTSQPRPLPIRQNTSDSMVAGYPVAETEKPHADASNTNAHPGRSLTMRPYNEMVMGTQKESPQSDRTLRSNGELPPKSSPTSLAYQPTNYAAQKRYGMSLTPTLSGSSETIRTPSPRVSNAPRPNASVGSRHSAERVARLRRMQSSTSLDSRRSKENQPLNSSNSKGSNGGLSKVARPALLANGSTTSVNEREGSQGLIKNFLSSRRREMRISEESSGEPAFL